MSKGISYAEILKMEQSEFYDWLNASRALDVDRKLMLMNIAPFAQPCDKKGKSARTGEFNKLKNEQIVLLGEAVQKVDDKKVESTWNKIRSFKVKRKKKDGSKRVNNKTKT